MTAEEFYRKHVGKAVDIDGGYGYQCVDLFKAFTKENYGISNYTCGNGWASGLWINRKTRPYYDKFIEVSINDMQDGDWIFWDNGSKSCPNSHVAMYYKGKYFGQNQNGKHEASLSKYSLNGVLGVLRPKMYVRKEVYKDGTYRTGNYRTLGNMYVRKGAGLNHSVKLVKDLTIDGRRNATSTNLNASAIYKTGTIFTAKDIINNSDGSIWARSPSGYICLKGASGKIYCCKV